jgi:epsin
VSAKELTSLILDEERLRSERADRKLWKNRVTGLDEFAPQAIAGPAQPPQRQRRHTRQDEEDAEMRLAIEASKHEAEEEEKKRRGKDTSTTGDVDDDLAKAIRLSKEEEALRARQLEEQNAASLFDDTPTPTQAQPTGYNQGYQQQPAVDWFGNPLQQQPQSTGYLNNQYAQPQQTGYQNGYQNGFPGQQTGYDQFGAQPFLAQQNTIQPQQTAFQTNNPYGMQQPSNDMFGGQQQQPQQTLQPGTHNPWASQSPQPAEPMKPLPTGSNNPFAQKTQQPQPSPFQRTQTQPSLGTLYEQQPSNTFAQPTQNPIANYQAPQPVQQPQQQQQRPMDAQYSKLNALLASGEGQDTFGNVGDLRIPAQHTAPGTFVNSAGSGRDRLIANQTGTNPFFSQQFTGAPQLPAQTGPAGGFGGYGQPQHNSFGARPGGQQGGSLIDL